MNVNYKFKVLKDFPLHQFTPLMRLIAPQHASSHLPSTRLTDTQFEASKRETTVYQNEFQRISI